MKIFMEAEQVGLSELIGILFGDQIERTLKEAATSFSMSDEHEKELINELGQLMAKFADIETYPADPEKRTKVMQAFYDEVVSKEGEEGKEAQGDWEKMMAIFARSMSISYYCGAKIGALSLAVTPPSIHTNVASLLHDTFVAGMGASHAKLEALRKEERAKKKAAKGEATDGEQRNGGDTAPAEGQAGRTEQEAERGGASDSST